MNAAAIVNDAKPAFFCPCCGTPTDRPDPSVLAEEIELTPTQRIIVSCLVSRFGRWVSLDLLYDEIWGADPNGGPITMAQTFRVHTTLLRARLRGYGWRLESNGRRRRLVWA